MTPVTGTVGLPKHSDEETLARLAFFDSRVASFDDVDRAGYYALYDVLCTHAPGSLLVPQAGGDPYYARLVAGGVFTTPDDVRVLNGRRRDGQRNCCRKYLAQKTTKYRLAVGYGLDDDGLWRPHAWLVAMGGRITDTPARRAAYFGIQLAHHEALVFAEEHVNPTT